MRTNRQRPDLFVASLVLLFSVLSSSAAQPGPNIVVFLVDDMGVMDTSVPFLTDAAGKPRRYPLNDGHRRVGHRRSAGCSPPSARRISRTRAFIACVRSSVAASE